MSQTCSKLQNDSIEDSEVENRLEKNGFADLVKDAKLVAGFSSCCHFRVGANDFTTTQPGCQDSFKMAAFKVNLSRRISSGSIAGTSEAETLISGKAECLLAIGVWAD